MKLILNQPSTIDVKVQVIILALKIWVQPAVSVVSVQHDHDYDYYDVVDNHDQDVHDNENKTATCRAFPARARSCLGSYATGPNRCIGSLDWKLSGF